MCKVPQLPEAAKGPESRVLGAEARDPSPHLMRPGPSAAGGRNFFRFGLQGGNVVVSVHKYLLLTDLYLWRFRTKTV